MDNMATDLKARTKSLCETVTKEGQLLSVSIQVGLLDCE